MQVGHVAVALTIASFAPELTGGEIQAMSWESIIVSLLAHEFPNFDGFLIMAGLAPKKFHCDMPSSVGIPLFLPFSKKRFTFNLWADTGYFGWVSFKGTYEQAWTWILEGGAFTILFVRLYVINFWPFS